MKGLWYNQSHLHLSTVRITQLPIQCSTEHIPLKPAGLNFWCKECPLVLLSPSTQRHINYWLIPTAILSTICLPASCLGSYWHPPELFAKSIAVGNCSHLLSFQVRLSAQFLRLTFHNFTPIPSCYCDQNKQKAIMKGHYRFNAKPVLDFKSSHLARVLEIK